MDTASIIFLIIVVLIIFLLLREVNCWYWKINKRISLLEEQNQLLKMFISPDIAINTDNMKKQTSKNDIDIEGFEKYETNEGIIFIKHNKDFIEVGDLVLNCFKQPYKHAKLKFKYGSIKITVDDGRIVEIM